MNKQQLLEKINSENAKTFPSITKSIEKMCANMITNGQYEGSITYKICDDVNLETAQNIAENSHLLRMVIENDFHNSNPENWKTVNAIQARAHKCEQYITSLCYGYDILDIKIQYINDGREFSFFHNVAKKTFTYKLPIIQVDINVLGNHS